MRLKDETDLTHDEMDETYDSIDIYELAEIDAGWDYLSECGDK